MKQSFEQRFQEMISRLGTSTYKIALSIGDDPSRVDQILFRKKPVKFEKRLETVERVSKSPLIDVDFPTLAFWLLQDYLPEDVFRKFSEYTEKYGSETMLDLIDEAERRNSNKSK